MQIVDKICQTIIFVCGILVFYKNFYNIIGFFCRARTYPASTQNKRYAFVIAARNEEKVVGNLLDSIAGQTYDHDLIRVFVVADNCSDNTAAVCREKGAIVYERFNKEKARK